MQRLENQFDYSLILRIKIRIFPITIRIVKAKSKTPASVYTMFIAQN